MLDRFNVQSISSRLLNKFSQKGIPNVNTAESFDASKTKSSTSKAHNETMSATTMFKSLVCCQDASLKLLFLLFLKESAKKIGKHEKHFQIST